MAARNNSREGGQPCVVNRVIVRCRGGKDNVEKSNRTTREAHRQIGNVGHRRDYISVDWSQGCARAGPRALNRCLLEKPAVVDARCE
jgi:hypothetical protein